MSAENDENVNPHTESEQREYPFGLSSLQFAILLVLGGVIGPGLLVYALEKANLPVVADLVWIVGYGTTLVLVWFVWLRPLDPVGSSAQEISLTEESDQSDTASAERDGGADPSESAESVAQEPTSATGDKSQELTQEKSESTESK